MHAAPAAVNKRCTSLVPQVYDQCHTNTISSIQLLFIDSHVFIRGNHPLWQSVCNTTPLLMMVMLFPSQKGLLTLFCISAIIPSFTPLRLWQTIKIPISRYLWLHVLIYHTKHYYTFVYFIQRLFETSMMSFWHLHYIRRAINSSTLPESCNYAEACIKTTHGNFRKAE